VFDSGPLPTVRKDDVIHKTGSAQHIATLSEEDRAMAASNLRKEFGEVQSCGIRVMGADRQPDKQTNKQTDILITVLRAILKQIKIQTLIHTHTIEHNK